MCSQAGATDLRVTDSTILWQPGKLTYISAYFVENWLIALNVSTHPQAFIHGFWRGWSQNPAVVKCNGYEPLGWFVLFCFNQREEASAFIRFSKIFITGRKTGQEVIQIWAQDVCLLAM